jgi:hypothetical protein
VAGALILTAVMLLMIPLVLVTGGILFVLVGWAAKEDAERQNEGSEFIELNT